ncbi:MAG: hypothetical protein ABIP30_00265 [Ferruginibacter sp.]
MRLTTGMLEILMDCHEREMMKQPPSYYPTRFAKGLIKRGLIVDLMYRNVRTDREELAFVITEAGKNFLDKKNNQ